MPETGMYVHGLNVDAHNWKKQAALGDAPYHLGRVGRAVQLYREKYPETSLMLFGSGASEKDGLKEADYTIKYMLDHFDELRQFHQFKGVSRITMWKLKNKLRRIAEPENRKEANNTINELRYGIPRMHERGIRRIVLISDLPHVSRCLAHGGQILEEKGLEGKVELVAEHSFYRHPAQKLSGVKVFEPEPKPEDDIQLGDMASQLFKIKKGNRSAFKEEYEALIAKHAT